MIGPKLEKFKVIQCNGCGSVQLSQAENVFKCKACGKSTQIFQRATKVMPSHFAVKILHKSNNERECTEYVKQYKLLEENTSKEELFGSKVW